MTSFLTLRDCSPRQIELLVRRTVELQAHPDGHDRPMRDMVVGMLFLQTSTRTRTAFTSGTLRLGGQVISYGPADLQLNTGETVADTGRVLSAMLDGLVVRTPGPTQDLRLLSDDGRLPVINAMTVDEHPSQAIGDLATILALRGGLDDVHLLYIGEGNSTAVALAQALTRTPRAHATFWSPPGYGLPLEVLADSRRAASETGAEIHEITHIDDLPDDVDVVYTSRWETTGTRKAEPHWKDVFRPFHIDERLMARWPKALLMHDLPAHRGEEISGAVLDGDQSVIWAQAQMKMMGAMAVLEHVATEGAPGDGGE